MYGATQIDVMGSWVHNREEESKQQPAPFSRPAITTGAHMPWNSRSRKTYIAPRAFSNQQSVPAITILNHKPETTKLVFSKDTQHSNALCPGETPFRPQAQTSLTDEEEDEEAVKSTTAAVLSEILPEDCLQQHGANHVKQLEEADIPGLLQSSRASTATRTDFIPNSELPNLAALNTPMCALGSFPLVKSGQLVQSAPDTNAELNLWKSCINESVGNRVKQEPGERPTSRTDSEQTRPILRAIPSEESSQMMADENLWLMQDLGMPSLDEHKVEQKTEAQCKVQSDDSPKGQALGTGKRKCSSLESNTHVTDVRALLAPESFLPERSSKRRTLSRSPATKSSDRKSQDFKRMEEMIKKLQVEQSELKSKLEHKTQDCSKLRSSLQNAREKLKEQEDLNTKLVLEMQFLRNSLSTVVDDTSLPSVVGPQISNVVQEMPWMDRLASICMPTQAEMAADLERDECPLIQATNSSFAPEWQLW